MALGRAVAKAEGPALVEAAVPGLVEAEEQAAAEAAVPGLAKAEGPAAAEAAVPGLVEAEVPALASLLAPVVSTSSLQASSYCSRKAGWTEPLTLAKNCRTFVLLVSVSALGPQRNS